VEQFFEASATYLAIDQEEGNPKRKLFASLGELTLSSENLFLFDFLFFFKKKLRKTKEERLSNVRKDQ
jgi:hypothetical protein